MTEPWVLETMKAEISEKVKYQLLYKRIHQECVENLSSMKKLDKLISGLELRLHEITSIADDIHKDFRLKISRLEQLEQMGKDIK